MKKLSTLLAHAVLILAVAMLTFFVIDRINPAMAFLENTLTKYLLGLFALFSAILAVLFILGKEKTN